MGLDSPDYILYYIILYYTYYTMLYRELAIKSLEDFRGPWFVQWRKPVGEFGGTEKIFADQDNFFQKKNHIFAAKISDDFF